MPPDEDPDRKHAAHVAGVAVHALGLRRVRTLSQAASVGSGPLEGVDVARCRRNGLANAPFPLPIFCPADNIEPARPGHLADLSFVDLQNRGRDAPVTLLPYVGPGWYPKVSLDYMLRCGVAQWSDVLHTMNAASHVTAECLAPALDVVEQAWPEAKLAVNSMIGLMAHDSNKAYTLRSSSNELDATGADTRQVFYVGEGRYVWDFIAQSTTTGRCAPSTTACSASRRRWWHASDENWAFRQSTSSR